MLKNLKKTMKKNRNFLNLKKIQHNNKIIQILNEKQVI